MTTDGQSDKLLVKDHEAAEMLSIGVSTFRKYVARGLLPAPVKIGGAVRWRVSEIQEWIGKLGKENEDGVTDGTPSP